MKTRQRPNVPELEQPSRAFNGFLAGFGLLLFVLALGWLVAQGRMQKAEPLPQHAQPDASAPALTSPAATPESLPTQAPAAMLEDDDFGVVLKGRALRRIVQMLQWREVVSIALQPGDEIVSDHGHYQLIWSEQLIDSSRFVEAQGHINPPAPPFRSRSRGTGDASWAEAHGWRAVPPEQIELPENLALVFRAEGDWLLTTPPDNLPEAGDLRVRFEVLPEEALPEVPPATAAIAETTAAPVASDAEEPVDIALRWIGRMSALILMMLGLGLALRGISRLVSQGNR